MGARWRGGRPLANATLSRFRLVIVSLDVLSGFWKQAWIQSAHGWWMGVSQNPFGANSGQHIAYSRSPTYEPKDTHVLYVHLPLCEPGRRCRMPQVDVHDASRLHTSEARPQSAAPKRANVMQGPAMQAQALPTSNPSLYLLRGIHQVPSPFPPVKEVSRIWASWPAVA